MFARFISLALTLLLSLCLSQTYGQTRKIYFVQYGDTIPLRNGAIWIEREYFDIKINLQDGDEVLMYMSADSANLHLVNTGTPPDSLDCFKNGTGLLNHANYRMNWLLFNGSDYMLWKYKHGFEQLKWYQDSLTNQGYAVKRTITSFDFTDQGALDGIFSVYLVPVTWLYVIYFVKYRDDLGQIQNTKPEVVRIRMI
jgi:hypothetical protein